MHTATTILGTGIPGTATITELAGPDPSAGGRLMRLLQITNASFPTGAFNHSFGFESWVDGGRIDSAAATETLARDWLRFGLAPCDGAAVALAYRHAVAGDQAALLALDEVVGAVKLTREGRDSSLKTGRAFMTAAREILALDRLAVFETAARAAGGGHQAVAYGVAAVDLDLGETDAVTTFLWSALSNLVAVVARLVPLGQVESQRIIAAAVPLIEEATTIARLRPEHDLASSFAALDVASMRHERLHTRLCMS